MTNPEGAMFSVELPPELIQEVQALLRASGIPTMKDPPQN